MSTLLPTILPSANAPTPNNVHLPDWAKIFFEPWRYKVIHGGRGGAKSWSAARSLLLRSAQNSLRIMCVRELQTSIAESVHRLLCDQIETLGLGLFFEVQQKAIFRVPYRGEKLGSEFIFYGIRQNATKVKSTEGVDIAWAEEAEKISHDSWQILIPTIRKPNSEIWVTFNPDEEIDPTFQRFVVNTPDNAKVVEVNWPQNIWFPEELRKEKDYLYRVDAEAAEHVWGGKCRKNASSQIFRGKYEVRHFTVPNPADRSSTENPMWDGPYYGADWGFSQDPCWLDKSWIDTTESVLYVEKEAVKVGLELDDIAAFWRSKIPEVGERTIRADSARPETISYVARTGQLPVEAAEKWSGSVEDGVAYLKKFSKIVFHPSCTHGIQEASLYSYKRDRLTGEVLTDIIDKHNHGWDSRRYAHGPMIQSAGSLSVWARL